MVCRTHDTIRHGQTRSPLFVRTRLMSVKLKTHSYTTCNTLYTYMCRYVQIQPIPRANMFQVVLNIRTPSGNVIYCINSTYISRRVGTYTWYILEICLPWRRIKWDMICSKSERTTGLLIDRFIHTTMLSVGARWCVVLVQLIRSDIPCAVVYQCVNIPLLRPHGLGASVPCPYRQLLVV